MTAPLSPPLPLSPLSTPQVELLNQLTASLDSRALWWLSGYAAGLATAKSEHGLSGAIAAPAALPATSLRATVLFGSQTGNARRVAEALSKQMEATGLQVRLLSTGDYTANRELKDEKLLFVVISTQGEGDPPDDSLAFVEFIEGRRAPRLEQLKFAVLGLGDTSYPKFCEMGKRLDARFEALGATRLAARGDADVDIETVATPWQTACVQAAKVLFEQTNVADNVTPLRPRTAASATSKRWTRENPFTAELLTNQRITSSDSVKDIRHIELLLEDDPSLHYQPGDALGIWPSNPAALVDAVLETLWLDGNAPIKIGEETASLRQWLQDKRELTRLTRPFLQAHATRAGSAKLDALLASTDAEALRALLQDQQLIDLLKSYPATWNAEEFVAALRPMTPRLYSIASSHKVCEGEVHLTVAHVAYEADGEPRWGAASHFLASQAAGAKIKVFIEHNERFRLPADSNRDIIMIGPGTGIAPFRAFVQERAASGARGKNWLFFGNPHFRSDFLYQLEWQRALKQGELTRIDLAFSRDQANKIYVQDRLREQGRQLYQWLENGAYLYVCGDANQMARDVNAALLDIIQTHGGKSADDAQTYLKELQQHGRYARDVY